MIVERKRASRMVLACLLAAAVAGCATQAQQRFTQMDKQAQVAMQSIEACNVKLDETEEGKRLGLVLVRWDNEPNKMQKMLDTRFADEQMKRGHPHSV